MSTETLEIVDAWFHEKVQAAPLAHHTECYNQMHSAWQDLRIRLGAEPAAPADAGASEPEGGEGQEPAIPPKAPPKAGK